MADPVIVTRGIGGQVYMDPATGRILGPVYTPPPTYPAQDRGYFKIVQPTNAPVVPVASPRAIFKPAEAYPLESWGITPQQSYDYRTTTDQMYKDYGYYMNQLGMTAEETAWIMGDSDVKPESINELFSTGE